MMNENITLRIGYRHLSSHKVGLVNKPKNVMWTPGKRRKRL
jgi:hypothetical protein